MLTTLAIALALLIGIAAIALASIAYSNAKKGTTNTTVSVPMNATAPLRINATSGDISLELGSNIRADDTGALTTTTDPTFSSIVTGKNFKCSDFTFFNNVLYASQNFTTFTWSGLSSSVNANITMTRVGQAVTLTVRPFAYPSTETNVIPSILGNPGGWSPAHDIVCPIIANHNNAFVQCTLKVNTNMSIYIFGPIFPNGINTSSGGSSFPLDVSVSWTMSV